MLNSQEFDTFIDKISPKIEKLGWDFQFVDNDTSVEFRQYTPAGEDFCFEVNAETIDDIVKGVHWYSNNFDAGEHAEMWLDAKRSGVGGVPPIEELVDDARYLADSLEELDLVLNDTKR